MKSQQIAVYQSLKDFMLAVGYANAAEQREDDPVWSTLNDNNFKSMMEYKFGIEPRLISVPTTLEAVHEGITSHEAWVYHEDLEHDDGEEAPVPLNAVAIPTEGETDEDDGSGFTGGPADTGDQDLGGGTGEPASTEKEPEGSQQQEPPADEPPAEEQQPATEEKPAEEGGDSEQE